MECSIVSEELINEIEQSEINYMWDRMLAIQQKSGNPEAVELQRIGEAACYFSAGMPWPTFNTIKGCRSADIDRIDDMMKFFTNQGGRPQFEIVPGMVDAPFLKRLSERGMYPSGHHTSMYIGTEPDAYTEDRLDDQRIRVAELQEDDFEIYATIHCKGTGLPDSGIPHVAMNNRILYHRPGWKFYVAYVDQQPAAAGVMHMHNRIASFTFAATLPEYRRLGLQSRLLKHRIAEAAKHGCRLAVSQCAFLSPSHRNMERVGMKMGYVRTTWTSK